MILWDGDIDYFLLVKKKLVCKDILFCIGIKIRSFSGHDEEAKECSWMQREELSG